MSAIQRFFMAVFPKAWAEDMRADSMQWKVCCQCGYQRSIWELGGIRWKATGNSRTLMRCPQCGKRSWHTLRKQE